MNICLYVYIYIYIFITVFSLCGNCIECLGVGSAARGSPIALSDLTHAGQIILVSDYIARLPLRWTQGHTYIDVYFFWETNIYSVAKAYCRAYVFAECL
jgi:hypothetical protein